LKSVVTTIVGVRDPGSPGRRRYAVKEAEKGLEQAGGGH
jgi:hypothetical protein